MKKCVHKNWEARAAAKLLLFGLVVLGACAPQYESDPSKAGPNPVAYRTIVAKYIRSTFFDPYSIRDASISEPITGRMYNQQGWLVCILANAKNRMGAYVGRKATAVLIFDGRVVDSDPEPDVCGQIDTYEPFREIEDPFARFR